MIYYLNDFLITKGYAVSWFYNLSPIYNTTKIVLIDSTDWIYEVTTDVDTIFKVGDNAVIRGTDGVDRNTTIISLNSANSFNIKGLGNITTLQVYTIHKAVNTGEIPITRLPGGTLSEQKKIKRGYLFYKSLINNIYNNYSK